jgi:lipopolysaccharide export system permease protein
MIYNRYIIKSLSATFLVVLCVLIGLIWLAQSLKIVELIINQGISFFDFLIVSGLMLPKLCFKMLPIACTVTIFYLVYKLQNDREIIILQVSGLSLRRIIRPFLTFASALTLVGVLISQYLIPVSFSKFNEMQNHFKNNFSSFILQDGVFMTQKRGFTIFISKKVDMRHLHGIFIYDHRKPEKESLITAKSGIITQTEAGAQLEMYDGTIQENNIENGSRSVLHFDYHALKLAVSGDSGGRREVSDDELTIMQLINSSTPWHIAEGFARILWPVLALSLSFMTCTLLLTRPYSRKEAWYQHAVAPVACLLCVIVYIWSKNIVIKNPQLYYLMIISAFLPFIVATVSRYLRYR